MVRLTITAGSMTSVIRYNHHGGHHEHRKCFHIPASCPVGGRRGFARDGSPPDCGSSAIASLTALPEILLSGAGWALIPWIAFVAFTATGNPLRTWLAWLVVALNVVWVVESGFLLAMDAIETNALGVAFVLAQAAGVLVLAALQATGLLALRRQAAA